MSTTVKILIGLAAAWLAAWINHGPAGNGARIVDALQAQADAVVTRVDLPGVTVQVQRDPPARVSLRKSRPHTRAPSRKGAARDVVRERFASDSYLTWWLPLHSSSTARW